MSRFGFCFAFGTASPTVEVVPWTIADFGAAFVIQAPLAGETTDLVMSGLDVMSYTDPVSGLVATPDYIGGECTLDSTALFGGYSSIRTSRTGSILRTSSGGLAAGVRDHYIGAMMAFPALSSVPSGLATCVSMGPMDGQSYCLGTEESGPNTFYGFGAAQYSPFETRTRFVEMVYTAADGQRRVYIDGALHSYETGRTATIGAGGSMGLYGWYDGRTQDARVYTALFRTTVPSLADRKSLIAHLGAKYAYERPVFVLGVGDSITLGKIGIPEGAPVLCSTTTYLEQLEALYTADGGKVITTRNHGIGGQEIIYHTVAGSTWPAGDYIPLGSNGTYGRNVGERSSPIHKSNVAVYMMGMNDQNHYPAPAVVSAATTTIDADALYARATSTIHALQADGYRVIVCGITPASGMSTNQSVRSLHDAYNARVIANTAGADAVIDVDSPALLPCVTPDGIHPDDDWYLLFAGVIKDTIASMGITV